MLHSLYQSVMPIAADVLAGLGLELGLFHTDASTRSEHSRQTTGVYVYHCAFTLARARAHAEITRVNVCVHSSCQRSARAFARVAEQGGRLFIDIQYYISLYARSNVNKNALRVFAASTRHERSPRVLAAV